MVERDHKLSLLLDVSAMLAREVELDALLEMLGSRVAAALHAERATIYVVDAATGELRSRVADLPELPEIRLPPGKGIAGYVADHGTIVNVQDAARDERHFAGIDRETGFSTRNVLAAPIVDKHRAIRGVVQALNKKGGAFTGEDEVFLATLATQVAQAFESTTLRPSPEATRGVSLRGPLNHVVGTSPVMQRVYEQILRAAATDATVLLRGETGVGKGLFARALHVNSPRKDGPLVVLDCTTLPSALAESELFGHERGAYTGADRRVLGKVELAHGGTLLLDEIGDLPPPAQSKLLRFLQDRAFERVGGRETLVSDARILAATHRDLDALAERGEFRQDLYYRVRVVEIALPPLRDRGRDEVLALARHFAQVYTKRHGRGPMRLTKDAQDRLAAHRWPGNVRELEHAIERAVVMAPSDAITGDLLGMGVPRESVDRANGDGDGHGHGDGDAHEAADGVHLPLGLPLEEVERRYVEATLAAMKGNRTRAAHALGVGRNTLKRKTRRS
ncbi:MAG TPA: sigma-54-dependent Fis family transcriptional regulator [Polyangiaceae bacterium]